MQGFLLLNKPSGITSFSAVSRIKRLAHEKRVGHTGTLDPMATGVLPVLIGKATALSSFLLDADKSYTATFLFGTVTDTDDITGTVIKTGPVNLTQKEIEDALAKFTGNIMQTPPVYSAIKQNGMPLYKLARKGEDIQVPSRQVTIKSINILSELKDKKITVSVSCSKGTYIRSLCRDIGEYLGCGATLCSLCRTDTAGFSLSECTELDLLNEDNISDFVLPEETAVKFLKEVKVTQSQAVRFCNGGKLDFERLNMPCVTEEEVLRVKYQEKFLGLGRADIQNRELKIQCIINGCDKV